MENVLDNVAGRGGLGGITMAAAYHHGRDIFPHNPRRKVYFLEGGTVFFQPDPSRYRGRVLQPIVSELARESAVLDERINHEIVMYLCGEDLPAESNRVELDWEHLDGFGLPGVKTHYALGDNSRRLGNDMIAHAHQVLDAAGAASVRDFGLSPIWGWHLLGTARMGADPRTSVDADQRGRQPHAHHPGARAPSRR